MSIVMCVCTSHYGFLASNQKMNRTNVARLETNPMGKKIHCPHEGNLSYVTMNISEKLRDRRMSLYTFSLVMLLLSEIVIIVILI
ncbi:hypothetical protein NDQ53_02670 [Rossellomorea marisflavi]|uniref:hypothetical protein n=1 Tax=Rossellomorea marisflavi TaxID=189381 RepID=UPI00203B2C6F|nr:hypothetical protein [Rossellomorea marisflavi]MCM2588205.1 hypothetical protein [Rossellomorea marisflavi]